MLLNMSPTCTFRYATDEASTDPEFVGNGLVTSPGSTELMDGTYRVLRKLGVAMAFPTLKRIRCPSRPMIITGRNVLPFLRMKYPRMLISAYYVLRMRIGPVIGASGGTPLSFAVFRVVVRRPKEKMIRVHTGSHIASMQHAKAFWNVTTKQAPRQAVGAHVFVLLFYAIVNRKTTVPITALSTKPKPARRCCIDRPDSSVSLIRPSVEPYQKIFSFSTHNQHHTPALDGVNLW